MGFGSHNLETTLKSGCVTIFKEEFCTHILLWGGGMIGI